MKELSIEEKAKRYDEILEGAKYYYESMASNTTDGVLEELIPELIESNDEQIRKYLIDVVNDYCKGHEHDGCIAWLEKQKVTDKEIIFRPVVGTDIRIAAKQALEKIDIGKKVVLAFNGAYIPVNGKTIGEIDSEYDTWLKKQGEQPSAIRWYDVSLIPQEMEELLVEWDSEDAKWHEIAFYHADTKTFWNGTRQVENVTRWCYIIDLLEKQGEKSIEDVAKEITKDKESAISFLKTSGIMDENGELAEEYSQCNNKPKFKVGDWIVNSNGKVNQVTYVNPYGDGYTLDDKTYMSGSWCNSYHLWTLKDSKDGDVLAFDNDNIVIFKDLYNYTSFHSYCHIEDGIFDFSTDELPDWWEDEGFKPATKEQRDLLFQKMKEAGYEWDAENKKLKKEEKVDNLHNYLYGEQNLAWSEEDEEMFDAIIADIQFTQKTHNHEVNQAVYEREIAWLKSLKERMKGE
ncbi:MAG: hypothetical protein J6W64_04775 [Bacilli bacterium]|nr:hypothetical protein [Bacilli bacterium]